MFVVQPQRASSFVSADWVFSKWTLRAGSSSFANKLPTLIKSQLNRLCGRTVFFWEKRTEDRFFQQSVTRWIDPTSIGCLAKLRRKFGASGRLGLEWFTTAHFLYQIIQINGIIIYLYYILYPYIYMCFIHIYIYNISRLYVTKIIDTNHWHMGVAHMAMVCIRRSPRSHVVGRSFSDSQRLLHHFGGPPDKCFSDHQATKPAPW